jgi:hypothetical protein
VDVDALTSELYALPPERFTAARDEAAKRLRADGRRADAERVRALRRPTVVAWAVNRLAQTRPELLDELLEAGAEVAAAQRAAMAGGGAAALRTAGARRRKAVAAAAEAAAGLLRADGRHPEAHLPGIGATLEAASADEAAGAAVRLGTLATELAGPSGFGLAGLEPVPAEPDDAGPAPDTDQAAARAARAARELADELAGRAAAARADAERTAAEAEAARATADELAEAARAAAGEAEAATERAQASAAAAEAASAAAIEAGADAAAAELARDQAG